ncbi:MAG: PilZ domain-containing protein [Mesorhizobium sp.]
MSTEMTKSSEIETAERRGAHRNRVFKRGTVRFNKGYGALECTVKNQSADGALLVMGETTGVPTTFDLVIGDDAARPALLRWRSATAVGVELG